MRHHALESGCFVVNATGWLTPEQIESVCPDPALRKAFRGGCYTAVISPEGVHLAPPLREGEGMVIADLDFSLITKRKRMMDSVGHYARPELLSLNLDDRPTAPVNATERTLPPSSGSRIVSLTNANHEPNHTDRDTERAAPPDHGDAIARTQTG